MLIDKKANHSTKTKERIKLNKNTYYFYSTESAINLGHGN